VLPERWTPRDLTSQRRGQRFQPVTPRRRASQNQGVSATASTPPATGSPERCPEPAGQSSWPSPGPGIPLPDHHHGSFGRGWSGCCSYDVVLTKPIRSSHPVRGWSPDRLARTACGSRSDPSATPAPEDPAHLEGRDDRRTEAEGIGLDLRLVLTGRVGVGVGAHPGQRHRGQTRSGSDQHEDDGQPGQGERIA
jgi:hypothetical protein